MLRTVEFVLTGARHGRLFQADARYEPTGRPKPVLVFVHGFKGFKDWGPFNLLADWFAARGFVFVKLNLSHNGLVVGGSGDLEDLEAFGQNNFSLELDDLGQLLDALYGPGLTPLPPAELDLSRLGLVGHSRGGSLVLLKAAEEPARVAAVATWAAVADLGRYFPPRVLAEWQRAGVLWLPNLRTGQPVPMYYQLAENYERHRARLDLPARLPGLRQPLLLVHGDQDETVPLASLHALHAARPDAEVLVLPGATHMLGGEHPWAEAGLPPDTLAAATRTAWFFARVLGKL